MLHFRGNRERERGQIVVLFALVLVVILAFTSLVIDIGLLRNNRQTLVNSLDSAALAGGTLLPVDGSIPGEAAKINGLITSTIQANYPGLPSSAYTISYKCLIGVDTSTPAKPYISRDVPLVCDPHFSLGHNPPLASDFAGSGPTRFSSCNPAVGDRCNAVLIAGAANTPFSFGRVVGVNQGSTGLVVSAACNGPCGTAPSSPVDVVLVIDRTSSMNGTDTTNAKAAANSLVGVYDPAQQWLALGTLGPSTTSGGCVAGAAGSIGTATAPADLRRWVPVGLSGVGSSVATDLREHQRGDHVLSELEHRDRPRRPDDHGRLGADPQRAHRRPQGHHLRDRRPAERRRRGRPELLRAGERRGDGGKGPEHRGLHDRLRPRCGERRRSCLPRHLGSLGGQDRDGPARQHGHPAQGRHDDLR